MNILKNKHLTNEAFEAFLSGTLDESQSIEFAEHIAECAECAARMVEAIEPCSAKPPKGFTEAVVLKINDGQKQKQREFRLYCAKIAACIAAVIGLSVAGYIYFPYEPDLSAPAPTVTYAPKPVQQAVPEPGEETGLTERVDHFFSDIINFITNSEDETDDKTAK